MADRADAADAGGDAGHFPKAAAFAEFLEAPELGDVEAGVFDVAGVVELDADFGMALDAGHGIDDDWYATWSPPMVRPAWLVGRRLTEATHFDVEDHRLAC